MKINKTNAMRLLERAGIGYEVRTYDYDPEDLSARKVAASVGEDPSSLYKTLVVRGEPGGVFVCLVAGDDELDLKKAASVSGNKRVAMVPLSELLPLTGYIRGGCTPVGMKKRYPVYIDSSCEGKEFIFISAGVRGMQLRVRVGDLLEITGAVVAPLV